MIERLTHPISRWPKRLIELGYKTIFPLRCGGCGLRGTAWCPACNHKLQPVSRKRCTRCGLPATSDNDCEACDSLEINLLVRVFAKYAPQLSSAILHLKYRPNKELANVMASWLTNVYRREAWHAHLVVPVPLSAKRHRQRGYNQAGLIACSVAEELGIQYLPDGLMRIRETGSQVGLNPTQRRINVQDAIQGNKSALHDKNILLVDDLVTTGATTIACAQAAEQAGARRIYALSVGLAEDGGRNPNLIEGEAQ